MGLDLSPATTGVSDWDNGWRLSLGLAAVPAALLSLGGLLLPESPNSLIERGHDSHGRKILTKLRGTSNVDAEFNDIKTASIIANSIGLREVRCRGLGVVGAGCRGGFC